MESFFLIFFFRYFLLEISSAVLKALSEGDKVYDVTMIFLISKRVKSFFLTPKVVEDSDTRQQIA